MPYLALFHIVLPLAGPVVDLFAVAGLLLHRRGPILFWFAFLAVQLVLAVTALVLDHEPIRRVWILPIQQIVHRQLTYLACYEAIARAIRGRAVGWNKVRRTGDLVRARPPAEAGIIRIPAAIQLPAIPGSLVPAGGPHGNNVGLRADQAIANVAGGS